MLLTNLSSSMRNITLNKMEMSLSIYFVFEKGRYIAKLKKIISEKCSENDRLIILVEGI